MRLGLFTESFPCILADFEMWLLKFWLKNIIKSFKLNLKIFWFVLHFKLQHEFLAYPEEHSHPSEPIGSEKKQKKQHNSVTSFGPKKKKGKRFLSALLGRGGETNARSSCNWRRSAPVGIGPGNLVSFIFPPARHWPPHWSSPRARLTSRNNFPLLDGGAFFRIAPFFGRGEVFRE